MPLLIALFILVAFNSFSAQAAPMPVEAQTQTTQGFNDPHILQGLTEVSLYVGKVDSWLSTHGVSASNLKTKVKSKLTAAGLKIVPEPAEQQLGKGEEAPPPVPMVYVHIKSQPEPAGTSAAFSAQMSLVDTATTKRGQHTILVSVWDANEVGTVHGRMSGEIDVALDRMLKSFLKDYQTANAKAQPSAKEPSAPQAFKTLDSPLLLHS